MSKLMIGTGALALAVATQPVRAADADGFTPEQLQMIALLADADAASVFCAGIDTLHGDRVDMFLAGSGVDQARLAATHIEERVGTPLDQVKADPSAFCLKFMYRLEGNPSLQRLLGMRN